MAVPSITDMDEYRQQASDLPRGVGSGDGPQRGVASDFKQGAVGGDRSPARTADDYVAWLGRAYGDRRLARIIEQPERAFIEFGKETGRILPVNWLQQHRQHAMKGGEEHWVSRPGNGRIVKLLKPGKGYSMDPLEYVMRIGRMHAAVPKLDCRVEGMIPSAHIPRIATSMREVVGISPTLDELERRLTEYGWDPVGQYAWEHAGTGVSMSDAAPDNFIQVGQDVVPIDVWFEGVITQPLFTRGLSAVNRGAFASQSEWLVFDPGASSE